MNAKQKKVAARFGLSVQDARDATEAISGVSVDNIEALSVQRRDHDPDVAAVVRWTVDGEDSEARYHRGIGWV